MKDLSIIKETFLFVHSLSDDFSTMKLLFESDNGSRTTLAQADYGELSSRLLEKVFLKTLQNLLRNFEKICCRFEIFFYTVLFFLS